MLGRGYCSQSGNDLTVAHISLFLLREQLGLMTGMALNIPSFASHKISNR